MAGRKPGEADGTLTVQGEWLSNFPYSELAGAIGRRETAVRGIRGLGGPRVHVGGGSVALCGEPRVVGTRGSGPVYRAEGAGAPAADSGGGCGSGWASRGRPWRGRGGAQDEAKRLAKKGSPEEGPSRPAASGSGPCWGKSGCCPPAVSGTGTWPRCGPETFLDGGGGPGCAAAVAVGKGAVRGVSGKPVRGA